MDEIHLSPFMNWLLRATWQSSVVILLVLGVQWLFRHQLSAKWRYRLWWLVLLRLVLPVSPPSSFSIFNYVTPRLPANFAAESASTRPATVPNVSHATQPVSASARGKTLDKAAEAPNSAREDAGEYGGLRMVLLGLGSYSFGSQCLMFLLLVLWPAGVVILVLKILRQNLGFALRVLQTPPITTPEILEILDDCKRLLDISTPILLVENKELKSPALYGCFRPRLLLPEGLAGSFSPDELKYIFLHELAHIKRMDIAVNWLMTGLQILHWFNPAIGLGFARVRADRELACDALVLSRMKEVESQSYGQTVVKLLESFVRPPRVSGLVGLLEEKEQMKQRITMIACFKRASQLPILAVGLLMVLGLVSLTEAKSPEMKLTGLVSWWRAEGNARDSAGANPATLEGGMSFAAGHPGKAFSFNGEDADVKIPASATLNVGTGGGFTIAAWINPERVDHDVPIMEWNSGSTGVALWVIADFGAGELYAELSDSNHHARNLASAPGLLRPHVFQHVGFSYDRHQGTGTLFVNGRMVALTFLGIFAPSTEGDLYLGLQPYGEWAGRRFSGQMDEIQVFSLPLSEPEVRRLYQAGDQGVLPNVVPN
jgi:beta-lactamase regulating signal transducer with metallopeptidase domain